MTITLDSKRQNILSLFSFDMGHTLQNLQSAFTQMKRIADVFAVCEGGRVQQDMQSAEMAFGSVMSDIENHKGPLRQNDVVCLRWYYNQIKRFVYYRVNGEMDVRVRRMYPGFPDDDFEAADRKFNVAYRRLSHHARA